MYAIGLLCDEDGKVKVLTPDKHYISVDCNHFSRGSAIYFGQLIDWSRFLK